MSGFGAPHLHLRSIDSTNERARELAEAGAPSGTIVTAEEQTAGRGRLGRGWSAPPGKALLFSAILGPLEPRHGLLPLAVPLAVCEAIESVAEHECRIKWPNDVWIDERKAAGVLIEARPPNWAVIGIGVNVAIAPDEFPADVRWPAASIGPEVELAELREALCGALSEWVQATDTTVLEGYRGRDALADRPISWEGSGGGEGVGAGIDERGNLLVERADGELVSLGSGEVALRLAQP